MTPDVESPGAAVRRVGYLLLASARIQLLVVRGHPAVVVTAVVQPAVYALILLSRGTVGPPAARTDVILAATLTALWGGTLWAAGGTLRRELAEGTLARNLTAVTDPQVVVIGKCLGSTVAVLRLLAGTAVVLALVAGASFPVWAIGPVVLGVVLVTVSGTALGTMFSSVFVLTRHAVHVTAALQFPVFILGGLLIPTSLLPVPLRRLSDLISLYWANRFLVDAVAGTFAWQALGATIVLTGLYFWAGRILFGRLVDRARRKGTIDLG